MDKGSTTVLEPGSHIVFGPRHHHSTDFAYFFDGPRAAGESGSSSGIDYNLSGLGFEYEVQKQIGKGSFATVRKGVCKATGKSVAIKIINKAVSCLSRFLACVVHHAYLPE